MSYRRDQNDYPTVLGRDWQANYCTIRERNKFMFNNSLLSDVKFIVNDLLRNKQTAIYAHKYVLSISSPVFYTMFFGAMRSDGPEVIRLPDCDAECFKEFIRYLYCDEVDLNERTVMQLLYLAKKYMVPSLLKMCRQMLENSLGADNVFDVLPSVLGLSENLLVQRCWSIVDIDTEQALCSAAFTDISREMLQMVLQRDALTVREADLFRAVLKWAEAETERKSTADTKHSSGDVLGGTIIKLIRFPTMTETEFYTLVSASGILAKHDVDDMRRFYSGAAEPTQLFAQIPRGKTFRCNRFSWISSPMFEVDERTRATSLKWNYDRGKTDCVTFSVTVPIFICGVRLFGARKSTYLVELKIFERQYSMNGIPSDNTKLPLLFVTEGTFAVDPEETEGYYGFDIPIYPPLHVHSKDDVVVEALLQGPASSYGQNGRVSVDCDGVRFKFSDKRSSNGTNAYNGQFAEILFKTEI